MTDQVSRAALMIQAGLEDNAMEQVLDEFVSNVAEWGEAKAIERYYRASLVEQARTGEVDNLAFSIAIMTWIARRQMTQPTVQYGRDLDGERIVSWGDLYGARSSSDNVYRHVILGETIPLTKEDDDDL